MDFSRPENARKINRLKVLSALRMKPASKAELAQKLGINKVSIGEICDKLRADGLIEETGKETKAQGRPGTIYSINGKAGRVFSIIIAEKAASVAVSDALGRILRFERFPKRDSFNDDLRSVISKLSGSARVYGAAVVSNEKPEISIDAPVMHIPHAVAEATAEIARAGSLDSFLFLSWSHRITGAVSYRGEPVFLPELGHIRAAKEGSCICGGKGCLEAAASGRALMERKGYQNLKQVMQDKALMKEAMHPLAAAIAESVQALSAESAIITGTLSQADDELFAYLQNLVSALLPPRRGNVVIYRGSAGENGAAEGAAIMALDAFFYESMLLSKLKAIEDIQFPSV